MCYVYWEDREGAVAGGCQLQREHLGLPLGLGRGKSTEQGQREGAGKDRETAVGKRQRQGWGKRDLQPS